MIEALVNNCMILGFVLDIVLNVGFKLKKKQLSLNDDLKLYRWFSPHRWLWSHNGRTAFHWDSLISINGSRFITYVW